ncbi:hypothetical protein CRG98_050118, partial [Punica granatum]
GLEEGNREELEKMKEDAKGLIKAYQEDPLVKLELIDVVQQLGLHYHFEAEIQYAFDIIHKRGRQPLFSAFSSDLYATYTYDLDFSTAWIKYVFKCFMNKTGTFEEPLLEDVEGL